MIIHSSLTPIFKPLYDCCDVAICKWYLYFVYGKILTKKTNKTVTRLAKRLFKTQLKNAPINLKLPEAFGEN